MLPIKKLVHGWSLTFFSSCIIKLAHHLLSLMSNCRNAYLSAFVVLIKGKAEPLEQELGNA